MKRIAALMTFVSIAITSGMGQSAKPTRRSDRDTNRREEICTIFKVDRMETKWTDLGLVQSMNGRLVKKKGCVEVKRRSRTTMTTKVKSF